MNDKPPKFVCEIGSNDTVVIDKLYGPLIMANLRITACAEECCWIIEREWIETSKYIEWCRIPAQLEEEFNKDLL